MKFSEAWLREWVNPPVSSTELVARLTMAGLEVDAVEPAVETLGGVVVGEIVSVEKHPDAEKLSVCKVVGHPEGEKQVVCGAPNARQGIKVPFATVGAKLPGIAIKKAKLRGVESFGMLCGQTELALGDDDTGLWELPQDAPVGDDLVEWLSLDDQIIEVDLTPNRSDCLSIRGLAREVGVLTECQVNEPDITPVTPLCDEEFPVALIDSDACPMYVGRVIKGVNVKAQTPLWMVEKLRRSGIRSIDPVVDVTNFVLLELGQPMHAFDLAKLSGKISVRKAAKGEQITLLNDQKIALNDDTLVIADDSAALAIAGVMGGADSAVSAATSDIFLESAFFSPKVIAGKARSYGLHTDSSHRFERGVDFDLQEKAVERATALLVNIVGGKPGPTKVHKVTEKLPLKAPICLESKRLESILGLPCGDLNVVDMMGRLGLNLASESSDAWTFDVPSYRFDLNIEEDLIEEVARIYGYDRLPSRPLRFDTVLESHSEADTRLSTVKNTLCSRGFQELVTYSFIDPKIHEALFSGQMAVELKNPISADMSHMRTSLIPGAIAALNYNLNRQQTRAKLFEVGMVFIPGNEGIQQENRVAGLLYGSRDGISWANAAQASDFFDIKADVEALLSVAARGRDVTFTVCTELAHMHPGQTATVCVDGKPEGYVGAIHPVVAKKLGMKGSVWVFELSLDAVKHAELPKFKPLSKFPDVTRDIAVVVDKGVCVSDIDKVIRNVAGIVLKELKLFDVYSGEGIDPQRKSLAFSLTFQSMEQTLTDDEVNTLMASIVESLKSDHGADLR